MTKNKECSIEPYGKFGISTPSDVIKEYLVRIEKTDADVVVLNMSKSAFVDSRGISFIIQMHKLCRKYNKYFAVIHCNQTIKDLLFMLRLNRVIPIS